ncbi:MAG: tRNA pseudouridine(55) synthase TruB [Oscillospiraceae bacterium]
MNGIVIIDKPAGWTSQDVTARLRRVFGTRRIGHGGTLDPMATGVLPVFVGRATRGVEFFEHAEKTYETPLAFGVATDTEDTTGTVLTRREVSVTQEQLTEVLERFRGEIMQIPPMYSALKVNGQKLCDLARKGRQVERQPRPVTIHELTLLSREGDTLHLRVRCSKGTYIRTLCADIGEALGCGGCIRGAAPDAGRGIYHRRGCPRTAAAGSGGAGNLSAGRRHHVPGLSRGEAHRQSGKAVPERQRLFRQSSRRNLPR